MTTPRPDLGTYDGREIVSSSVKVTGAGDGLSDALTLDPVLLHTGDEITLALRCRVADINHKPIFHKGEDQGTYDRVAKLVAVKGVIVDSATVDKAFKSLAKRVEAAAGIQHLPGTDED